MSNTYDIRPAPTKDGPLQLPFDAELQERLDSTLRTMRQLQDENRLLRDRLALQELRDGDAFAATTEQTTITDSSPRGQKIALFRNLFRGREDVYAQRWEAADGRRGYSPVLRPGIRRVKGQAPDPDDYVRLNDDAIRSHLEGRSTLGVYPLLRDETTCFLAIDFDKFSWREDVQAVLASCHSLGVPATIERSRSGQGAHIWLFFERPISAAMARNLGCVILTKAIDRRYQIDFASYDRLFPSQDTMPKGGFGNLIALPLQGKVRPDNTVFLTYDLNPYPDQWAFLASIKRMPVADVEKNIREASSRGAVIGVGSDWFNSDDDDGRPWELPPSRRKPDAAVISSLPEKTELVIANRVFINTEGLPSALIAQLRRLAAFQNPEFYLAQRMRMSTFGKPRIIGCAEEFSQHLALPRGCIDAVGEVLEKLGVTLAINDERQIGTVLPVAFHGELSPEQYRAGKTLLKWDSGVLSAPTAFGKTVLGAWLIAQRRTNTLILVHRRHLLDQWRERLASFLDIPIVEIGQIGAGRRRPTGTIDVGLLPSLTRKGDVDDIVANYGQVIVDECHHIPAFSFERVMAEVQARYVVGLTATPIRKDGHHPIVVMQCGPIRCKIDARKQAAARAFDHVVIRKRTGFGLGTDTTEVSIQQLFAQLVSDKTRTQQIVMDVLEAVQNGRSPLVLTERTEHLTAISEILSEIVSNVVVLRGGMGVRQRKAIAERLAGIPEDAPRVIVATGRYAGEGFDDHRLDTLFLAMPVAWRGTIQQYAGRLHRTNAEKRVVQIYDYVDVNVPVLGRMYDKRVHGYAAIGYRIIDGDSPRPPAQGAPLVWPRSDHV